MSFDLAPERSDYGVEDRRWYRDTSGWDSTLGVTLDGDAFDATRFPDGVIPSGTLVAQITAAGAKQRLWGPFDPAATDGRQTPASGKVGHLQVAVRIRAGRRVTTSIVDKGAVLRDYLPTPPTGVTGAAAAVGVLTSAVEAAMPRIRYTNGKAA